MLPEPDRILTDLEAWLAGRSEPDHPDELYCWMMWRCLLAHHRPGRHHIPPAYEDSLPYLPVDPADFGVDLRPADTVLDVGCLGGYGLCDFLLDCQRRERPVPRLIALDHDAHSLAFAAAIAPVWSGGVPLLLLRGCVEALPVAADSVRLVLLRLVLPYVDIAGGLAECARVLAPDGLLLVQLHTPAYYRKYAWLRRRTPLAALHSLRALAAGGCFSLTGRQARWRMLRETPLTMEQLRRLAEPHDLEPVWQSDLDPTKPFVLLGRAR